VTASAYLVPRLKLPPNTTTQSGSIGAGLRIPVYLVLGPRTERSVDVEGLLLRVCAFCTPAWANWTPTRDGVESVLSNICVHVGCALAEANSYKGWARRRAD
jgi:Rieske Fe-S protein